MFKEMNRTGYVLKLIILSVFIYFSCNDSEKQNKKEIYSVDDSIYADNIAIAEIQYNHILNEVKDVDRLPNTTNLDGSLHLDSKEGWVSGFFPGSLWYLYELTGKEKWKKEAIRWTETLDTIQWYDGSHDIGFMINCSYGNALRLTGNKKYEPILINTAKTLSKRYNDRTKTLMSWDRFMPWGQKEKIYDFIVIIDNMMNLELLYKGAKLSGDSSFENIANTHANSTIKHHYRPDFSSYHAIIFDKDTGKLLAKKTAQGYSDNSSWARGQAWGLYGYIMSYRETKNPAYLKMAKYIASYIMNNKFIPKDKIPLWDYHIGQPGYNSDIEIPLDKYGKLKDVSSASITASALFEFSTLVDSGKPYYDYANDIINVLSTDKYRATKDEKNYFILKHSVGSIPHMIGLEKPEIGQIDKPLNYADYYFLEALVRKKKIDNGLSIY